MEIKLRPGSMKVVGGETYSATLHLICEVEGTPKGAAAINVEVSVESGRFTKKGTTVSLSDDYQHRKFRKSIGVNRTSDVKGLRQAAEAAAKQHWEKFAATKDQIKARDAGEYDGFVALNMDDRGQGQRVVAALADIPFASYRVSGHLQVNLGEDRTAVVLQHHDSAIWREARNKDEQEKHWLRGIESRHCPALLNFTAPIIKRKLVALEDDLLTQKRATLARNLEYAKQSHETAKAELSRRGLDVKSAIEALESFDRERLASEFLARLADAVSVSEWSEIVKLNREEKNTSVCHSHDFVDANVVMEEAFVKVMGRESNSTDDSALWNEAWTLARTKMISATALGGTSAA